MISVLENDLLFVFCQTKCGRLRVNIRSNKKTILFLFPFINKSFFFKKARNAVDIDGMIMIIRISFLLYENNKHIHLRGNYNYLIRYQQNDRTENIQNKSKLFIFFMFLIILKHLLFIQIKKHKI